MKNRIILSALALVLTLFLAPLAVAAPLEPTEPEVTIIEDVPVPEPFFRIDPEGSWLTRNSALSLIYARVNFPDGKVVPFDFFYPEAVIQNWAIETGLIKGRGGDDYAWESPITIAEAYTVIHRLLTSDEDYLLRTNVTVLPTAEKAPSWARNGIVRAFNFGYLFVDVENVDDGLVHADFARLLDRALGTG